MLFKKHPKPAAAALPSGLSRDLSRILRPQAAYRWLLPQLAAITPQYIEMTLRGAMAGSHVQAWELFDLMEDSWPRLLKNERELKTGVLNLSRQFIPWQEDDAEPTATAREKSRLISAALRSMRPNPAADENALDGTIFDILDAWFKGQTVLEVDWEARACGSLGTVIAPRATYWVHPTCYAWDMRGSLGLRLELTANITPSGGAADYAQQLNPKFNYPPLTPGTWQSTTYQPLPSAVAPFPPDKFLLCISKAKSGTALGGALLRPLAWWWCAANFSADWLLNLAQVFGLPFRWATYDPSAPQASVDAICNMLQNMGSNAWAAYPAGTTFELKEPGRTGDQSPQGDLLDRADKQCDLLVLGQTLTSDTGGSGKGGGSLALGKVHAGVKEDFISAAAKYVKGVLETQLFPSIIRLNYGRAAVAGYAQGGAGAPSPAVRGRAGTPLPADEYSVGSSCDLEIPSITFSSEKEEDQVATSQVIATLASAGFANRIGLDWLGKKFGIPKPAPNEETLGSAPAHPDALSASHPVRPMSPIGPIPPLDAPSPLAGLRPHPHPMAGVSGRPLPSGEGRVGAFESPERLASNGAASNSHLDQYP